MRGIKLIGLTVILAVLQGCAAAVVGGGAATGAAVAVDRRTTGAMIDDQGIEFKASSEIYKNKDIHDQSHINVTSFNGVVLVTGETPSAALKKSVTNIIQDIPRVRKVYNELAILAPSAVASRTSDTWITSKVKSKLLADKTTKGLNTKVVTERGIVYLMGKIKRNESDNVVRVVRSTGGVQKVVKVFEYID
ncbi:21 kDa hemolysin precursor [Methylophaga frappieri]|uniref:21 kDa hemolysin n=1 Tax=Methylophaga frappieri (strain ATCC BAA-2434 / DSM 25690 / JAM7) TaxID=754477 RepID=I1YGK8_METFJ|nr:BON domain-containing protein [Methylophaga frappieri]AFJ02051.1 21 kDa hemolysin precursor [Methylophaga frappieri]